MNICPNCGGDIDVLEEMFPDGWTTCEELELTEEEDNEGFEVPHMAT